MTWTVLSESPVGPLRLTGHSGGLCRLEFSQRADQACFPPLPSDRLQRDADFSEAIDQLRQYFNGGLQTFTVPLAPEGTVFQRKVWWQLQQVPWGVTASYADVAKALGQPSACRAVGMANARNPLPILIPCHRIIGRQGALTGYNGGVDRKLILLELEGFYFQRGPGA
ncbi:MAG: methylated-DNA--[protein]-cysteine S-methyltransferase [Planctomycetota bacterium]